MIKPWHWCLLVFSLIILGCGGGGGGTSTPSTVNIVGQILWIETGAATNPASTVRVGQVSAQTDLIDGFFSLDAPAGSSSLTVTFAPTGSAPVVRTFTFPAATTDVDLGDLYIGPSQVTVSGTVVDSTNQTPVSNATVSIAGKSAKSNANGQFSVTGVAFSGTNLAVFLGLQGTIIATNYFNGFFNPTGTATGGIVNVGVVNLTPVGSTTPPGLPFNLSGSVLPTATSGGSTVQAKVGTSVIRTVTADGTGRYEMWLPAGSYTITASKATQSGSAPVTISDVSQLVTQNVTLN